MPGDDEIGGHRQHADDGSNGNDGTLIGSPDPTWVAGAIGGAIAAHLRESGAFSEVVELSRSGDPKPPQIIEPPHSGRLRHLYGARLLPRAPG